MLMRFIVASAVCIAFSVAAQAHGPKDPPHQSFALGDLKLESGEAIKDFSISYATHGTLNAAKSNAILMVTAISGNHHRIDYLIGPGRALDPAKYFIIATDAIGNGLTTSPSSSKAQPEAARFIPDARFVLIKPHQVALGHWSGAGATGPEIDFQNREIDAFLDVVTDYSKKIQ